MKWQYKLANALGYDLIRSKRNNWIYERSLSKILDTYKVDTVLDVGANCGQFAEGLRKYGFKGQIVSFEPVSACYKIVSEKAAKDSKWKAVQMALGNARESKNINVPKSTVFSSFLKTTDYSLDRFSDHKLDDYYQEMIQIDTLDQYAKEHLPNLANSRTFLKIDTQGFDMNVLLGAKDSLKNFVGISTELSFIPLYDQSTPHTKMLSFLEENAFGVANIFPVTFDEKSHLMIEADCIALNKNRTH